MAKKLALPIGILILVCLLTVAYVLFLKPDIAKEQTPAPPPADPALYAESYPDYADDVYLEYKNDPELTDEENLRLADELYETGLYWIDLDENGEVVWVPADSDEGAALIDPDKPTVVNIHGMMIDGATAVEKYFVNSAIGSAEELGLPAGTDYAKVKTLKLWIDQGWNVGIYNWARFTAESIMFWDIESKVWATDGPTNVRWADSDGTQHDFPMQYTMGELFAADYIRAVNRLPEDFGKSEIRFTAHSMGGQLVAAGAFLLSEVSKGDDPQISPDKLPDRITMDDTFFGVKMTLGDKQLDMYNKGLTVRWSGEPMPGDRCGMAYAEAVKALAADGVAIEYYTYDGSSLHFAISPDIREILLDNTCYILMDPDYAQYFEAVGKTYTKIGDGHTAERQFSQCSIVRDYPEDDSDLTDGEKIAYANAMPTEVLKNYIGKAFMITQGGSTLTTADDLYEEVDKQQIMNKYTPLVEEE